VHVLYVCRLDLQLPLLQNALADANAYAAAGHGVGFLGPVVSQNTFGVLRGMQARNAARQQRNPNAAAARVDADQRALDVKLMLSWIDSAQTQMILHFTSTSLIRALERLCAAIRIHSFGGRRTRKRTPSSLLLRVGCWLCRLLRLRVNVFSRLSNPLFLPNATASAPNVSLTVCCCIAIVSG
jgi:hypothetical protein